MTHVTDSTFAEILANNSVCVLDFSATWCAPCKKLSQVIEDLATEYEGKALIAKIDIEECPETTEMFEIMSVPTVLFFKNGELQSEKVVGFDITTKQILQEKIDALI